MIPDWVDPKPFEPAIPSAVRELLARGRVGDGPLVNWFRGPQATSQVIACGELLHGRPERLSPEAVGWLCGITLFGDGRTSIAQKIVRLGVTAPIPWLVDAFIAGIAGGLVATPAHWKSIDSLTTLVRTVPDRIADVLAVGCASDHAVTRAMALQLAVKLGAPARDALVVARAQATRVVARRLDAAIAVLPSGDACATPVHGSTANADVELLERLLAAWRDDRDPDLETPIARLGQIIANTRGALAVRSKAELEATWLALAAANDPADVDRLLDAPWPGAWKLARARVVALARFPSDPRIACKVVDVARNYRAFQAIGFHQHAGALLATMPTAGALAGIDAIEAIRRDGAEYLDARSQIDALEPRSANPALLDEARQRLGDDADLEALQAAHLADPGDLQHRSVLADALQRANDPRGEFIALQLSIAGGARDLATRSRAAALLASHIDDWVGLPGVEPTSRRFERGFLVALRTTANPAELAASFDRAEWVTVEDLAIDARVDIAPLLARMPLLRRLALAVRFPLDQLTRDFPAIRALACNDAWDVATLPLTGLRVVGGRWTVVEWSAERFARVQRAAVTRGATAIVHFGFPPLHLASAVAARASGPPETRFALGDYRGFDGDGWLIRVRRADATADLGWAGGRAYEQRALSGLVESLIAAGIRALRVQLPTRVSAPFGSLMDQLVATVARLGATITFDGAPIDLGEPA